MWGLSLFFFFGRITFILTFKQYALKKKSLHLQRVKYNGLNSLRINDIMMIYILNSHWTLYYEQMHIYFFIQLSNHAALGNKVKD